MILQKKVPLPYYSVIFTSVKNSNLKEYNEISTKIEEIISTQKGYIGMDTALQGIGITISYWESLEDIKNWKANPIHLYAQKKGKKLSIINTV